jgi:hypothetical protein
MVLVIVGALCVEAAPVSATAAPFTERDWIEVTTGPRPPAIGALAYDEARAQNVLLVPAVKGARASQTWVFDGATRRWSRKYPATAPPLYLAVAAYDPAHRQIVALGSDSDPYDCHGQNAADTWTWNGVDWTEAAPATAPTGCVFNASYDPNGQRILAITGDASISETWTWDGTTWTHVNTPSTPRYLGMATATDPNSRAVLAFGGDFFWHGDNDSSITYRWSGSRWSIADTGQSVGGPDARTDAAMTYDSKLKTVVMVGGETRQTATAHNDTFRWNGRYWTRMSTQHRPPPGPAGVLADNPTSGSVLFNGSRTWVFTKKAATSSSYAAVNNAGVVVAAADGLHAGDLFGRRLNQPIVGITRTPSRTGYWLVARDGGIFTFGDAKYYGSTGGRRLNKPIVAMASTPGGEGYWLVASDGGIFSFGDARFYGSTGAIRLNQPIVGIAATPTGDGYWLVARDGGIFTFGDAKYYGSTGAQRLNKPIVSIAATPTGQGYWLVASDGGVFAFGNARYKGAAPGAATIVGMASTATGNGYWLFGTNGTVQAFGDAPRRGNLRIRNAVAGFAT